MSKNYFTVLIIFVLSVLMGCAQTKEVARTIWGSSTRVLERERINAVTRVYDCSFDACFDTVVQIEQDRASKEENIEVDVSDSAVKGKTLDEVTERKRFTVFMKNRTKKYVVVVGIPGAVDTTEVGIFFTYVDPNSTQIDLSSLSSHAKRIAAEIVFQELDQFFQEVK